MATNETIGPELAALLAKILDGTKKTVTPAQLKKIAAVALPHARGKSPKKAAPKKK
jgi:hypothetical protein